MYEFQCGSPVCRTRFTAETKDDLMRDVIKHVHQTHRIAKPTRSIMEFLEANTVRQS